MKKITHNQTLWFTLLSSIKSVNVHKLSTLLLMVFLSSVHFESQAQNNTANDSNGKVSIRQNSGTSAKSSTKTSYEDFTNFNAYKTTTNTNVCSPESSLIITEQSSWGISRSTINNSGLPSFCLSLYDESPKEDDIFNTTLTPAADISFNNSNYNNSQIIDKVKRTLSVKNYPSISSSDTSLTSDFYKAIAVVIWHYTDDLDISNYDYSWVGGDGNTYTVAQLKQAVDAKNIPALDVIWLIPQNSDRQPEALLNTNTSSDCCPTPPSLTTSTNAATSNNNGEIILESVSSTQYYGISSLDASSYDGPTTIATATAVPNSLPSTILSNAPENGGTYIIRAFTNIDGCFTDYTVTVPSRAGINCSSTYATYQSDKNNVNGKNNVAGAPDGSFAEIHNNNQQLIVDFNEVFPAGTQYKITWRVKSGESGTAIIDLSESTSASSGFVNHPTSPQTTSKNFITTTVIANSNFRYLAFDKGNSSTTDYDLDAVEVTVCLPCEVADNTTTTSTITENETKKLTASPSGGTFSIVSGGGTINGNTYTPDDINANTDVVIRYTKAANGSCTTSTDDVTFTVIPSSSNNCGVAKTHQGGCWSTEIVSVLSNNNKYDVEILVTYIGSNSCKELSYFSVEADNNSFSNVAWAQVSGNPSGNISNSSGNNDPFDGFKLDNVSNIGDGQAGSFKMTYTLNYLQDQQFLAKVGNDYSQIASFTTADFQNVLACSVPQCDTADNTTSNAQITEGETKTLTASPAGGTFSIVSGGGTINGNTYTPADINGDTNVKIRYTIAANGSCAETSDDVTFNVKVLPAVTVSQTNVTCYGLDDGSITFNFDDATSRTFIEFSLDGGNTYETKVSDDSESVTYANLEPGTYDVWVRWGNGDYPRDLGADVTITEPAEVVVNNTTSGATISENQTKTLSATPAGGTWSIVSGGGSINGNEYLPGNINTNTTVKIRYTVPANGTCSAVSDEVTFTVTPVCLTANNTTSTASITEDEMKTLSGTPAGGTFSIVSGGGTINGNTYTPDDINTDTTVVIRYTIAADGDCAATTDDVTFTVTPVCDVVADNTTSTASITEGEAKTLSGSPAGGTFSIVSGGGTINGFTYTPDDINTDTTVVIRYTIAADGDCGATTDDVTFTVTPVCDVVADNTTSTASITEGEAKTLSGSPAGGTFSIVSGGGTINGTTYTPDDINTNTTVVIRYTIAADGDCAATTDDVTFTVTPVCDVVADNTTSTASITEGEAKTLSGSPAGGTFSIVSGGGTINGFTYTPDDINTDTTVVIRYTIAADGDCGATTDDVTFTVTPVCDVVAVNTTSTASITEGQTKTLTGAPAGGTFSIVSGGGTINGNTYTPDDINTDTTVVIRYTIAADGDCAATTDDITFTVTANTLGTIGDTVWFDTDGDAIKDTDEDGLEGATVTLDPGTPGNTADDVTTLTDANGNYLFENLTAGDYTVSVDLSTVTSGVPAGFTTTDLIQTFDADGVSSSDESSLTLSSGENNLDQDFAYNLPSGGTGNGGGTGDDGGVGSGNDGGVESESLGDAISKIYVGRKKNSVPTVFVKDKSNLYNKTVLQAKQPYQGKGQTMLDMFPTELVAGNVANVTSPTDILDYTIADEVLSVDFSLDGETKGVVLGIKTSDKVYNHTKASCDRLRGAEILNIQRVQLKGYNFLMQAIKQRNGVVEYAISFAVAKNNNDDKYSIQTNWYVNNYIKFNDMYNFQVWSIKPDYTQKLLSDIIDNLESFIPVKQEEIRNFPETYASKIYREKGELVVALRSTEAGNTAEVNMTELYSETANNIKYRINTLDTEIQQSLRLDIADGYEYDGLIKVDDEIEDAFYHADGNWGLDFDKRYTTIKNYFVWNDFNRTYQDDEYAVNRSVEVKATTDYDYLTVYKSLLPGTISADYSEYKYLAFTAKGSGMMEIGLLKASIEDWKEQYRIMVDFSEEEQTYYIPFEAFTSVGTEESLNADDLTTITFNFLPVEANTKELDLMISDVRFTKVAGEGITVNKVETFENEFMAYPNPSKGNVNLLLFSQENTEATVTLTDITGKTIYKGNVTLTAGKNELDYNFRVKAGVMFLKVASKETNYGTSKIIFR